MSASFVIMAMAAAAASTGPAECPASLVFEVPDLAQADEATANAYASCVASPWLPLTADFAAKAVQCGRPHGYVSATLSNAVQWIDKIANNFAGCETRVSVKRK